MDWTEFIELGGSLLKGHDSVMTNWRAGVLEAIFACPHDAVIFSHFVPVNVLTGRATRLRSGRVLPTRSHVSNRV